MGTSKKNVCSKKEEGSQGKSLHILFLKRHSIVWKRPRERGCLKIITFERTYFMDCSFLKFCIWACCYALHWNLIFVTYPYTIFYKKFNIFSINSILQNHIITVETLTFNINTLTLTQFISDNNNGITQMWLR